MTGTINELMQSYLDQAVNGPVGGTPTFETIASWTGTHTFTRPATAATVTAQNAASAIGNGSSYDCGYIALATAIQIKSSATLTAGVILIQGSVDNTDWADLQSITASADFTAAVTKSYSFAAGVNGTARFWRVRINTTLVGGNITAKIRSS